MTTIEQLADRIAELEARLGVGVEPLAANPPIAIGELADVPAPGSAILSAWTQEVSRRIVHRFTTVAQRDSLYPAASAGAGSICITQDSNTIWFVNTLIVWAPLNNAMPWQSPPSFQNGWINFSAGYQDTRYRRIGDMVFIEGRIKSGTMGAAAFTLPAGYRPPAAHQLATTSNGGATPGMLFILNTGVVTPGAGSNADFSVNCCFGLS